MPARCFPRVVLQQHAILATARRPRAEHVIRTSVSDIADEPLANLLIAIRPVEPETLPHDRAAQIDVAVVIRLERIAVRDALRAKRIIYVAALEPRRLPREEPAAVERIAAGLEDADEVRAGHGHFGVVIAFTWTS